MGVGHYFMAEKPDSDSPSPPQRSANGRNQQGRPSTSEKPSWERERPREQLSASSGAGDNLQIPTPRHGSSRPQSISGRSVRSTGSSVLLDDIKHEVMVNYLYQQQCSHLWVSDGSGEIEGVLLRKSRGQYMACPPQLGTSPFAIACAALNVHVRRYAGMMKR